MITKKEAVIENGVKFVFTTLLGEYSAVTWTLTLGNDHKLFLSMTYINLN